MGTFKKLKKFNLNSLNAQGVDVKTPISAAQKLINFVEVKKDLRRKPGFDPITFTFSENSDYYIGWKV